ncbi:MAG: hypothetical protein ACKVY0_06670 [Prosthecobacter sp.]|uniref:hypothetical protein n=1 Tax=Prosthecobacter sp. TaxID=1965333 RepID=UPI0039034502
MSIALEPNKGLRLKLGRISPIRTWHGGGNFWSHEFQLTIRSGALAGFLPRAIEDEDSVLFEYRSGGTEQASTSVAISSMSEIPAKELNALRAAVDELKRKAEDPHCDRTKRQMIEGFRLPDPQKDRDLYRLIGKGPSAKLIVLWGIEREEGSALAPGAAVDLMHTPAGESEAAAPVKKKSKLVPVLLLLALLSGGGWYFWHQGQEKLRLEAAAVALAMKNAEEARLKAEQERIAAFNATTAAKAAAASSTPTASTTPMTPMASDPAKPIASTPPSTISSDPKKSMTAETKSDSSKSTEPKKSTDSKSTASTDSTKKSTEMPKASTPTTPATSKSTTTTSSTTAIKPLTAAPGTIVRNSSGVVTGVFGRDGKVALANPGTTVSKDGKVTTHTPGTVIRGSSGACTGVCDKDGKVIPAKLGRIIEDAKGTLKSGPPGTLIRDSKGVITGVCDADGKIVSAVHGTVLDKEGKITTSAPGTVLRDSFGTVTGVADADGKIVSAAPGAVLDDDSIKSTGIGNTDAAAPSGSVTTPMTSQGPPPAGISSLSVVSTSLSPVLGNGNVEVLLNVVARDNNGAVVNAPLINAWKVDGQLMSKPDGTPADGPVLPVSLPPGTHSISTVGKGADGQPYQTDAEVTVTPK